MSLFRKLFGNSAEDINNNDIQDVKSPYAPDAILPVDEQFTFNFKGNGGKFIYCENLVEVLENFENILAENDWFECNTQCYDKRLFYLLDDNKLTYNNLSNPVFFLSSCENLIADEGSILFSSTHLKHFKPNELPTNMIIFATTSQIVQSKSDGLRRIKNTHDKNYPSNITAIKYFKEAKEQDFLHYGSCPKNIYLLLLEDL